MININEQDKNRIKDAIAQAESTTSGEIVPLIVRASDNYPHADFAGGIIAQALAMIAAIWFLPTFDYLYFTVAAIVGFLIGYVATRFIPTIKRAILGKKIVTEEVYQRAIQAFFEHGVSETRDRTGILIMISLLERRVQIVADRGINEKVKEGEWDETVSLILKGVKHKSLVAGLCDGILRCGEILTKDFPIKSDDTNELKNDLLIE